MLPYTIYKKKSNGTQVIKEGLENEVEGFDAGTGLAVHQFDAYCRNTRTTNNTIREDKYYSYTLHKSM